MTNWIQIFGGSKSYTYYNLFKYFTSKIKVYEKGEYTFSDSLYLEWFTFDTI